MGQDFHLQLFLHGEAPLLKKKKEQKTNLDPLLPHSVFKTALQKNYSMAFKSETLQHTSESSACTRQHPSYHSNNC